MIQHPTTQVKITGIWLVNSTEVQIKMLFDFRTITGKHFAMKVPMELLTVGFTTKLTKMINSNLLERIWLPLLSSVETFTMVNQYLMTSVNQLDLVHGRLSKMNGKPRRNDGAVTILFSRSVLINYNSSSKRDILRFCGGGGGGDGIGAPASGGSEACDALGCTLFDREFSHSGSSLFFFLVKIDTK